MLTARSKTGRRFCSTSASPTHRQWAIDVVAGLVRDYKIDWYEEDFNIEPNPYLETAAEPTVRG
jgi:hypothetical protein